MFQQRRLKHIGLLKPRDRKTWHHSWCILLVKVNHNTSQMQGTQEEASPLDGKSFKVTWHNRMLFSHSKGCNQMGGNRDHYDTWNMPVSNIKCFPLYVLENIKNYVDFMLLSLWIITNTVFTELYHLYGNIPSSFILWSYGFDFPLLLVELVKCWACVVSLLSRRYSMASSPWLSFRFTPHSLFPQSSGLLMQKDSCSHYCHWFLIFFSSGKVRSQDILI